MKQPELGKKIARQRSFLGLTQEQLAEKSNINIRTIQRIESGEVMPRSSTLGIILEILELDFKDINGDDKSPFPVEKPAVLNRAWIAGIFLVITYIIYDFLLFTGSGYQVYSITHLVSLLQIGLIVIFDMGKIHVGKVCKNQIWIIAGVADIVLFVFSNFIQISLAFSQNPGIYMMSHFMLTLLGLNGILFGIGILQLKQFQNDLMKATGIMVIAESLFFVFPVDILHLIGCFVCIPTLLLETIMFYQMYSQKNYTFSMIAK